MSRYVGVISIALGFASAGWVMAQPQHQVTPWEPRTSNAPPLAGQRLVGLSMSTWSFIGPGPLNSNSANGNVSGRIAGVDVDPTNANIIYIAAAGGGVWKTVNGGTSWSALTDPQQTLSMGAIAVAPSNPNFIYAGTGEANNSADSNYGRGILVSTNGGASWTLQTGPGGIFNTDRLVVSRIAVDPANANTAYAAFSDLGNNGVFGVPGSTGIWKTTDGGGTWTNLTAAVGLNSTRAWSDVQIDPTFGTLFAAQGDAFGVAGNGVYKSTNGGSSWTLCGGFPSGVTVGRIALGVEPFIAGGADTVYAAATNAGSPFGSLLYIRRSDDACATSADLTANPGMGNFEDGQGWYDHVLRVDRTHPGVVIVAGSAALSAPGSILRSADGGATWTNITGTSPRPHVDHHDGVFDINGRYLDVDDGGIYRLDDPTVPTWSNLNDSVGTIQFQGIGLHPTDPNQVIGASQDNGTEIFSGTTTWSQTDGGDGGFAKFSQTNGAIAYHQIPNASFGTNFFRVSTNGGATWATRTSGISADVNNQQFYAPFVVDPNNGDRVLYGTNGIWETTNQAVTWTKLAGFPVSGGFVNAIGLAPADPNTIYAAAHSGSGSGFGTTNVFVTVNHGATWTQVNTGLPSGAVVQDIQVDPTTSTTAYLVLSNFSSGGNIFKTINGGGAWTNISGNIASVTACACAEPVWSLQIDSANGRLFIGADDGVYATSNGGTTWSRFGTGFPDAQVFQIELNRNLSILGAATHGRSAWEISTAVVAVAPDFLITKTHAGNFTQGQVGASYTITVSNTGTVPTTGTVTVIDTLPAGLTATALSGAGWTCTLATLTCTRSDALAAGSSYPPITLTVNVASNAPPSVTNTAAVTGGGVTPDADDTANDPTAINPATAPDFLITKTHAGNFTQGQVGASYTITVSNTGTAPTTGTVTVTDTLPAGLTATAISGAGWTCTLATLTCTRSDALAGGSAYPPITLTVNVASNAPPSVTNTALVSGGGVTPDADDAATDPTVINPAVNTTFNFLVRYAANLNIGDSFVDITNNGVNGASLLGPGFGSPAGNLCVNVYAFSPDEQLVSCCSCLVTPNALVSLSVNNDLVSNTLTGVQPNSVVIKLIGTATGGSIAGPTFSGTSCANSAATAGSAANPLAAGILAWGTTIHTGTIGTFRVAETPFSNASLSASDLASLTNRCANILANGSTHGICGPCRAGGLGATRQ